MATFLGTRRMAPALVARIESSLRGRDSKARGASFSPRLKAVFRLALLLVIAGATSQLLLNRQRDQGEFERARAALLQRVNAQRSSLKASDADWLPRISAWLTEASGAYAGDFIADELRAPAAIARLLTGSAVFVKGPIQSFTNPTEIQKVAFTSRKDAFLLCLLDPPSSRTEKVLLRKVRTAYAGGVTVHERTTQVHRLYAAEAGLPLLMPAWTERIRAAKDPHELARLEKIYEQAPLEEAKQAASAALLLFAMDEAGDPGGSTELDGERAHEARIGIVDLAAAKVLLRIRRRIDPRWISLAARTEYASGLDACVLALDVYESVGSTVPRAAELPVAAAALPEKHR